MDVICHCFWMLLKIYIFMQVSSSVSFWRLLMKSFSWREMTRLEYFSNQGQGEQTQNVLFLFPQSLFSGEIFESRNEFITHRRLIAVILLTIHLTFYFSEICCPIPDLENGEIISKSTRSVNSCVYFYRDTVFYMCYKKYRFEARCEEDGTWNPKTPTCDKSKSLWNFMFFFLFSFLFLNLHSG